VSTRLPAWETVVDLYSSSSRFPEAGPRPGRDLALDIPRADGDLLATGVLLDDWLPGATRDEIDRQGIAALGSWRERRDGELTIHGIRLAEVWEVELLAEVFLPETRIVAGLMAALEHGDRPSRITLHGVDHERAACLEPALAGIGIEVVEIGERDPPPQYPGILAAPVPPGLRRRVLTAIPRVVGIPRNVRGNVFFLPYWHLLPVFERLEHVDGVHPILDPGLLPGVPLRDLARSAYVGGWVGKPGFRARQRSRQLLESALSHVSLTTDGPESLEALLDRRALRLLQQRAADTVAVVGGLRRAFGTSRVRAAVVPYDSPPEGRAVVQAARDSGVPTLVVQHGFFVDPHSPDKTSADIAAVWSDVDVKSLRGRTAGRVIRTGNPGIGTISVRPPSMQGNGTPDHTVVLVEYQSRLSVQFDLRLSARHVMTALRGIAAARPASAVTIRPHPSEHEPAIFDEMGRRFPGLDSTTDAHSPIADVIARADLFVAAVSTAALQAAAAGVPTILLNVTGRAAPWPFDGSTDVPVVATEDELAQRIPQVLGAGGVPGRDEMLHALGVDEKAIDHVVRIISGLVVEGNPLMDPNHSA
jgi:hypothetical protein